jgi:phosphotransferase system IIB component
LFERCITRLETIFNKEKEVIDQFLKALV